MSRIAKIKVQTALMEGDNQKTARKWAQNLARAVKGKDGVVDVIAAYQDWKVDFLEANNLDEGHEDVLDVEMGGILKNCLYDEHTVSGSLEMILDGPAGLDDEEPSEAVEFNWQPDDDGDAIVADVEGNFTLWVYPDHKWELTLDGQVQKSGKAKSEKEAKLAVASAYGKAYTNEE